MPLEAICPGQRVEITEIPKNHPLRKRLESFGVLPGREIVCRYTDPKGDLVALEILGTVIAARVSDLRGILVRSVL